MGFMQNQSMFFSKQEVIETEELNRNDIEILVSKLQI